MCDEVYREGCVDTIHNSPMFEEGFAAAREKAAGIECNGCSQGFKIEIAEDGMHLHLNEKGNVYDRCRAERIRNMEPNDKTTNP